MMPKEMRPNEVPQQETINVRGQKREYHFVETVKSMEELETFRFKNFCVFNGIISNKRVRNVAKSFIMPCTRKKYGKRCDFELRAVRPSLESGTIHVYGHSQHNHPILPEERRAIVRREKELMPDANPPAIFRTPDNIDWQFLQTLSAYEKMQKFRRENHGQSNSRDSEKSLRTRFLCKSRKIQNQCKFMLLAMKTTSNGYHVYKHGEHNLHHFMPADNPPSTFKTPDNLEWAFLQTFVDFDKMDEFRRTNHTHAHPKIWYEKSWQKIRLYCYRRRTKDNCQFMLLAMKTAKQVYHVYKHGEHDEHCNHLAAPNWKPPSLQDDEQNVDQQEQMVEDKEDENDEEKENEPINDDEGIEEVEKEGEENLDQHDENGEEEPPSSITKKINGQENFSLCSSICVLRI